MEKNSAIHRFKNVIIFSSILVFYNIFLVAFLSLIICLLPFLFWNKRFTDFFKRMEIRSPHAKYLLHGASVGEHSGTLPLKNFLDDIIFSVNTTTGYKKLQKGGVSAVFLPWDLPIFDYFFIKKMENIVIFESEFAPNLIFLGKLMGKKMYILNGRVSQKRIYLYKILKDFYKELLKGFNNISVINEKQQKNFKIFDVKASIIKNTKYLNLNVHEHRSNKILLFASTHISDEIFIKKFLRKIVNKEFPIVIAPRHVDRIRDIMKTFLEFNPLIYGDINKLEAGKIYIVDKMGIMDELYEASFLTFMGGTFDKKIGGHNPLEPISFQSPVVFGPHYENFQEEYKKIMRYSAGDIVYNTKQLIEILNQKSLHNVSVKSCSDIINSLKPQSYQIKLFFNIPNNIRNIK